MKTNEIKCCTPSGQIKRYKDCIGCDRNPLELNQNKMKAVEWLISDLISKGLLTLSGDTLKSIGKAKEMEKEQRGYTESDMRSYASYILNNPVIEPSQWYKIYRTKSE